MMEEKIHKNQLLCGTIAGAFCFAGNSLYVEMPLLS